jgi:hypothetical protein
MSAPVRRNVGQKTTIATAIRQNLNSYSDGQILDELLQNADDARADRAAFMLDLRHHATRQLYGHEGGAAVEGRMAELQGPALVAFDSAVFQPDDFEGLFSFGQGSKKFDPTRTGKFGLGFNSVYHMTDVPMFVSGEWLVVLDPLKGYYPGLDAAPGLDPGSQNAFASESYEALADQFEPFRMPCFGSDLRSGRPVDGTLFRLPLRTAAQAARHGQHGLRPGQSYTPEMVRRQFQSFRESADEKLLFFKHVRSIELWEWHDGEPEPRKSYAVTLDGPDLDERTRMTEWLTTELDRWQATHHVPWRETAGSTQAMLQGVDKHSIPRQTIKFSVSIEEDGVWQWHEEWWLRSGVGLGAAWDAACADYQDKALTLFPHATVAARVHSQSLGATPKARHFVGRAFATLPTQMVTGYPCHVNARWCLGNNRVALKTGTALSDKVQVEWNRALIADTCANLWCELLLEIKERDPLPVLQFYSFWPQLGGLESSDTTGGRCVAPGSPWAEVINPLYCLLGRHDVLRVQDASVSMSLDPATAVEGAWTHTGFGRWSGNLHQIPTIDADVSVRAEWLTLVLRRDVQRNLAVAKAMGRAPAQLVRSESIRIASLKWRRTVRNLISFFRERGLVATVLQAQRCPWLLSTPQTILTQFQASAAELRKAGHPQECLEQARNVSPEDVRAFFRDLTPSEFSREPLDQTPFSGFHGPDGITAVVSCLRYCTSDLEKDTLSATALHGLALLPLANGDLFKLGARIPDGAVLIVSSHRALTNLLLGSTHPLLVHPLAAPVIRDWVVDDEVAAVLDVVPFSIGVLADRIQDCLPGAWKGKSAVAWDGSEDLPASWVRAFFLFLILKECDDLSPFDQWPVVPNFLSGASVLLAARHRNCILRRPREATGSERASAVNVIRASRAEAVSELLAKVGVPMLDTAFASDVEFTKVDQLWERLGVLRFCAEAALDAVVHSVEELQLDLDASLSPFERESLLDFWQAADLSPHDLERVKHLPLFEKEVPPGAERQFVSIADRAWCMMPEDIEKSDLRGEFITHKRQFASLYAALGIEPLTRRRLYIDFIFPEIQAGDLNDFERGRHMHDVHLHLDQLIAELPTFVDVVGDLKFVPVSNGELVSPRECFDPRQALFVQFFEERLPNRRETPPGWSSTTAEWLGFLGRVGMILEFSLSVFLSVARAVSAEATAGPVSAASKAAIRARASRLTAYLMENFEAFKEEPDCDAAFHELSTLSLAEPMTPLFPNPTSPQIAAAAGAVLIPYSATARASRATFRGAFNLAWSQRPIMKMPSRVYYVKVEFCSLMRMITLDVNIVLDHLLFIRQMSPEDLSRWSWYNMLDCVDGIYAFLQQEDSEDAYARLTESRCLLLDRYVSPRPQFIEPQRVFTAIAKDAPPFAYDSLNLVRGARNSADWLQRLGVRPKPSEEQIASWLQSIQRRDFPIDNEVDTAVKLLDLFCETFPGKQADYLLVPSADGELRPLSDLVVDDAPWLNERIVTGKVPMVHPRVDTETSQMLGAHSLSESIEEILEVGFDVQVQSSDLFNGWQRTIGSVEFRHGIFRLLKHEQLRRTARTLPDDILDRLAALSDLILIGVQSLRSRFIWRATGEDITAVAEGSSTILQQGEGSEPPRLFMLLPGMRQHQLTTNLTIVINRLLGGCVMNLQPLSCMLSCEPSEIESELDFHRIGRLQVVETLVGSKLTIREQHRAISVQDGALRAGSSCVWTDSSGLAPVLRHGSIVTALSDGGFRVLTSEHDEQVFAAADLQRLLTDQELREAAAAEADAEAQRHAASAVAPPILPGGGSVAISGDEPALGMGDDDSSQPVERQLYRPEDPDWMQQEEQLIAHLRTVNRDREQRLQEEPEGIDSVLVQGGFDIPSESGAAAAAGGAGPGSEQARQDAARNDAVLSQVTEQVVATSVRPGYDLVRVCNIDEDPARSPQEIAFFHHRGTLAHFDDERRAFVRQCCGVLRAVAKVFDYHPAYVTLFYQKLSTSRFIRQKIMFNIWQIDKFREAQALVGTTMKCVQAAPVYPDVAACLGRSSTAFTVVAPAGLGIHAASDVASAKIGSLSHGERLLASERVTVATPQGPVERVRCESGWASVHTPGATEVLLQEHVQPSPRTLPRSTEIVVLEVYVSGDRSGTAGGTQLVRCELGWLSTRDDRSGSQALEPVRQRDVAAAARSASFDIRTHAWPYMYFYGLFAHKLAHFFDVVHGTRHDFFMNEYRIESMTRWITLLRRKGFDPAALEAGPYGAQFLKQVVL